MIMEFDFPIDHLSQLLRLCKSHLVKVQFMYHGPSGGTCKVIALCDDPVQAQVLVNFYFSNGVTTDEKAH